MPPRNNVDPVQIIRDGDVNALVNTAQELGRSLQRGGLTTSQIRNIFGEVRTIEMNWQADPQGSFRRTVLLQPKLAYAAARHASSRSNVVQDLADSLTACIGEIQRAPADMRRLYFDRFVDFFEAILAYHREAGGR